MPKWAADFALGTEISRDVLNLVLEKFLDYLRAQNQHTYTLNLGFFGNLTATLTRIAITDLDDPPPLGGVVTDLEANGDILFYLFRLFHLRTRLILTVDDVELDFAVTQAGMPRGLVIRLLPTFRFLVRFQGGILGFLLNLLSPLVQLGVWLIMGLIRKVEIPVWELVDIFAILGIRFVPGSPLLTVQKQIPSLLLASDFNLTDPLRGNPQALGHFLPAATNIGAVLHQRVIAAALHVVIVKGWLPTRFKVSQFTIYITSLEVEFQQDLIVAKANIRAKRKKCWTKVKATIRIRVEVNPRVVVPAGAAPWVDFRYNANVNAHISTSGMLVILGVIMFAPLFLALTIGLSSLTNVILKQFFPFTTTWQQLGLILTIQASGTHHGFVPLSMNFPLQLSGNGSFDLAPFRQFSLPGGSNVNVGYTTESLSLQDKELRIAAHLS